MAITEIVHRVEARFLDIGKAMIQADPVSEMQEELDLLQAEYNREDDNLATIRGKVALLAQRLADNQEAAALLPGQVESSLHRGKSSQAMRQALQLDNLRRSIEVDQTELPRIEHSVWCLEFRLRQLERQMQRLREELAKR